MKPEHAILISAALPGHAAGGALRVQCAALRASSLSLALSLLLPIGCRA